MTTLKNHFYLKITAYTFFYITIMSLGLDLVQAQASQIIPYIAWSRNPDLFQNDILGATFPYYSSLSIWYGAAGWLGHMLTPMTIVYIYFFVQCALEVFGIAFLVSRILPDRQKAVWVVLLFLTFGGVLRFSLGSVSPFGWSVFPDSLAAGILLFALGYTIERKFDRAFYIIALSFYIHLSMAAFLAIIIGAIYVLYYRNLPLAQLMKTGIICVLLLLPFGMGLLNNTMPGMEFEFERWLNNVKNFQGMHTFPSRFGLFQYIPFLFMMTLYGISLKYSENNELLRIVNRITCTIGALFIISTIFVEFFNNSFFIRISFFRGSRFLIIIALVYIVSFGLELYNNYPKKRKMIITISLVMLTFLTSFNLIVFHPAYRFYPDSVKNTIKKTDTNETIISNNLLFQTLKYDRDFVRSWKDAQTWIKNNTPEDAMILTPYYIRGFRTFSERSIVFQMRDSDAPKYYYFLFEPIRKRTELIGATFEQFSDPVEFDLALKRVYLSSNADRVRQIDRQLKINYIVTENGHDLEFPLIYNNEHFNIYLMSMN